MSVDTDNGRLAELRSFFLRQPEDLFSESPFYQILCRCVADEPRLLEIALLARPGQSPCLMLFAAVHFLVLRGAAHPLGALYADLGANASTATAREVRELFRDFCLVHEHPLRALVATRRVQTNEVGRGVFLRLGAEWAGERFGARPLSWIEIGASAGLNLAWDEFSIVFRRGDADAGYRLGRDDSGVVMTCTVEGGTLPFETAGSRAPAVAERVGLELDPVELADPQSVDWLAAFVWADHTDRLERFRNGVALARRRRPALRRADATAELAATCAAMRTDTRLFVAHTFLLSQLPAAAVESVEAQLAEAAGERPLIEVGAEWIDGGTRLDARVWEGGQVVEHHVLARADPHGSRVVWAANA